MEDSIHEVTVLHPTVSRVDDVKNVCALKIDGGRGRLIKLAGAPAAAAEFRDEIAVKINDLDAIVSRIRDIQVTEPIQRQSARLNKLRGALTGAADASDIIYAEYLRGGLRAPRGGDLRGSELLNRMRRRGLNIGDCTAIGRGLLARLPRRGATQEERNDNETQGQAPSPVHRLSFEDFKLEDERGFRILEFVANFRHDDAQICRFDAPLAKIEKEL